MRKPALTRSRFALVLQENLIETVVLILGLAHSDSCSEQGKILTFKLSSSPSLKILISKKIFEIDYQ